MYDDVALKAEFDGIRAGREGVIVEVSPGGRSVTVEFAVDGPDHMVRREVPVAQLDWVQVFEEVAVVEEGGQLFKIMCWVTAVVAVALFVTLLIAPNLIYWLFGLDPHPLGDFMGRRAAMLFAGIGALALMAAPSGAPETRNTVGLAVCVMMFGLAVLGVFELLMGGVGVGILLAVAAEVAICVGFLMALKD